MTYYEKPGIATLIILMMIGCNGPTSYEELEILALQDDRSQLNPDEMATSASTSPPNLLTTGSELARSPDPVNDIQDSTESAAPDDLEEQSEATQMEAEDTENDHENNNNDQGINDQQTSNSVAVAVNVAVNVDADANSNVSVDVAVNVDVNVETKNQHAANPKDNHKNQQHEQKDTKNDALENLRRPTTIYTHDPLEVCEWSKFAPDPNDPEIGEIFNETYTQPEEQKLDILWVVDNSGSMQEEQANLATNFKSFIEHMSNLNIDFQIAVTSTDICGDKPDQYCPQNRYMGNYYFPQYTPLRGHFSGSPGSQILRSTDADLSQKFMENVMLGIHGSGAEHGLTAATWAIEKSTQPNSDNYGFLRDNSFLAVIMVSDEEDNGVKLSLQGRTNYYFTGEDLVSALSTHRDSSKFTVNAIVGMQDPQTKKICKNKDGQPVEEGKQFLAAAELTGGRSISICDQNFADSLETLGFDITSQMSQIVLKKTPFPFTLKIFVDDVEITKNVDYVKEANAVRFPPQYMPTGGQKIKITYYEATQPSENANDQTSRVEHPYCLND